MRKGRFSSEGMTLLELSDKEIEALYYRRMQDDFPALELKKLDLMLDLHAREVYLPYKVFCNDVETGYAFFSIDSERKDICLLDYFAVEPEFRGRGAGSQMLLKINDAFSRMSVLLCEVEDPFMETDPDLKADQQRRMDFYLKTGWRDSGVSVCMYDVNYRILAAPVSEAVSREGILEDYRRIYLDVVGKELLDKNLKVNHPKELIV